MRIAYMPLLLILAFGVALPACSNRQPAGMPQTGSIPFAQGPVVNYGTPAAQTAKTVKTAPVKKRVYKRKAVKRKTAAKAKTKRKRTARKASAARTPTIPLPLTKEIPPLRANEGGYDNPPDMEPTRLQ